MTERGTVPNVKLQETSTMRSRFKFHSDTKTTVNKEKQVGDMRVREKEVIENLGIRERNLYREIQEIERHYEDLEQEMLEKKCEREVKEWNRMEEAYHHMEFDGKGLDDE